MDINIKEIHKQQFDISNIPDKQPLPPGTFQETKEVIDILKELQALHLPKWNHQISFEEWLDGFKKWKETTSSSLSGRHIGIYRALITAHTNNNKES